MLLNCHSMKRDVRIVRYSYCSIAEWNHLLRFEVDNCIFVIRVKYQVKFLVKPETLLGEPDLLEGARADHRKKDKRSQHDEVTNNSPMICTSSF